MLLLKPNNVRITIEKNVEKQNNNKKTKKRRQEKDAGLAALLGHRSSWLQVVEVTGRRGYRPVTGWRSCSRRRVRRSPRCFVVVVTVVVVTGRLQVVAVTGRGSYRLAVLRSPAQGSPLSLVAPPYTSTSWSVQGAMFPRAGDEHSHRACTSAGLNTRSHRLN